MKFSKETVEVLKNFSTINTNILFNSGNTLSTISSTNNIVAFANIDEYIEKTFGVYDLKELLSVYNSTDGGEIFPRDKYLDIIWGKNRVKYGYGDSELLYHPSTQIPAKHFERMLDIHQNDGTMSNQVLEVNIDTAYFKTASIMNLLHIEIVSNGSNVKLKALDYNNPSSNSYEVDLETECDETFEAVLDINSLKILPGEYSVKVSKSGITCWKYKERPITYYITLDTVSQFS